MKQVVGSHSGWLHMLVWLGLFGLVASLHGIIMGYARQIFALARAGFLPKVLGRLHPRFQTPYMATIAGGVIGIAAIFSDDVISINGQSLTATLVTMSVFGALTMYVLSMISLFRLRRTEPDLHRSYRAPFYPVLPAVALVGALIALVAVIACNGTIFCLYLGFMVVLSVLFMALSRKQPV